MKKVIYFLPVILFILLGIFLFRGIQIDPSVVPSALIDKPVPAFTLPTLETGKLLTEQQLKGQIGLLNVWATWCISCRMEHSYLLNLKKQGVNIVGINYKDDIDEANKWLHELGNPYAFNVVDKSGQLGMDLGVFGAPETFLIDKNGIIRYKRVGVIDERVWREELEPAYLSLQDH